LRSFGGDEINFPENSFLSLKVPINNEMANFSNSSLASAKMTMEERGFDPPLCQDLLVENE
jgi:UDP-glucose 6-dehydrogenase